MALRDVNAGGFRRGVGRLLLLTCNSPPPAPEIAGDTLLRYVETQLAFGPRIPGSPGHRAMGQWLDSVLRTRADLVVVDTWRHVTARGDTLPLRNILARFRPEVQDRVLYVAHWDTRPRADGPSSRDSTLPVPGANDGASGVALLLGVADALHSRPPLGGVDLLFVDGEDFGSFQDSTETLLGSRRYASTLARVERPILGIVWDMVGDRDQRFIQEGYSLTGAPELVERIWAPAERLGYQERFVCEAGRGLIDDHLPLQRVGIPTIDVIDLEYGPNNAWHHTPNDTRERLSAESMAAAAHVATALLREPIGSR